MEWSWCYFTLFVFFVISLILNTVTILLIYGKKGTTNSRHLSTVLAVLATIKDMAYILKWIEEKKEQPSIEDADFWCKSQAVLLIFCSLSEDLWVVSIIRCCYATLTNNEGKPNYHWLTIQSYIINFSIPFIILLIFKLWQGGDFGSGKNYNTCWITFNDDERYIQYKIEHYGLKWICIIINSIITIIIIKQFRLPIKNSIFFRNIIFLSSEVLGTIIPTVRFFIDKDNNNVFLIISGIVSSSFQGILYSICFLITNYELVNEKWKCIKKQPAFFDDPIIIDDNKYI